MSDNEIRIAIAEKCGIKCPDCQNTGIKGTASFVNPAETIKLQCSHRYLPDYPNDLNAMHEAENLIDQLPVDGKSLWWDYLAVTCGWPDAGNHHEARFAANYNSARATARQRAEAFLRTFGLWPNPAPQKG